SVSPARIPLSSRCFTICSRGRVISTSVVPINSRRYNSNMRDYLSDIPAVVVRGARRGCSRRSLLAGAALGLPGMALCTLATRVAGARQTAARAKAVLVVYAGGGISHHDAFDPKPDAPPEVRGEFTPISTALPGVQFTEFLPALSRDLHGFA